MSFLKYLDRRFLLPLITILVGAAMVFTDYLTGAVWAGLAGTLTSGYMTLSGWSTTAELKAGMTYSQLEAAKNEKV